jgi:hypothetical protein
MGARLFGKGTGKRSLVPLASLLFSGLVLVAVAGDRGNQNPGIIPNQSNPHGKSYGEWGAAWWQWALSTPAVDAAGNITNPLFTGSSVNDASADVDLSMAQPPGNVWFLAGAMGVTVIEQPTPGAFEARVYRRGSIPSGTTLFFPLLNSEYDNIGLPETDYSMEDLAAWCASSLDAAAPFASVDGVPVTKLTAYRGATGASGFMYQLPDTALPAANVYQYLMGAPSDPMCWWNYLTGPVYDNPAYDDKADPTPPDGGNCPYIFTNDPVPAVSDGYWLMLAPLPIGQHTITFGGTMPWGYDANGNPCTFTLYITYNINVTPRGK